MKSVLSTCVPKESIVKGTFNPEVFTAALGPVIQYYKGNSSAIDEIYTDAEAFFREATYPTYGLKQTVSNVFRRISGDGSVPTVQRLETAFGGGKTHILIACVHLAYRGKEISDAAGNVIESRYLPEPGTVTVAGVAGDEIPVNKIKGDSLIPYTLWGELAYQIGGKELYNAVKDDAESYAAPGKPFLDTILKGRKILIMLDELAQYAARLEVAVTNGSAQLAAFLMSLIEYAKATTGISIVVTLASAKDAFARQTETLTKLLNNAGDGSLSKDDAVSITEGAARSISSVISRNEATVTPVNPGEISAVLAKRLFQTIDLSAAKDTAEEYAAMYRKNASVLPDEASRADYAAAMVKTYPFHPSFIKFLSDKLSQAENFQGTRGVLRTLALTVRSIWTKKANIGMIHVSDIDLQNAQIVDEILGRTSSADLHSVLAADVGSIDTAGLEGGQSNAQRADRKNPHPDGIPMYEKSWRVVFLNSLVGRTEGKASRVFGITEKEALLQTATPLFSPAQVRVALEEISNSAFYLRYEDGKYFAHLDPTINSVLAMIRSTVDDRQIRQRLKAATDSIVSDNQLFHIERDVRYPQDISDNLEKPNVAVIALDAEPISLKEMFITKGDGIPRRRQNLVLLLVPKTVEVTDDEDEQTSLFMSNRKSEEARDRLETIARQVLAFKALEEKPQSYGIAPGKLHDPEFIERKNERNLALNTAVTEMYTGFYFAGPNNAFIRKELRTAAGESGATILGQIEAALTDAGELIKSNSDRFGTTALQSLSKTYFFTNDDRIKCSEILERFYCNRSWPIIPNKEVLEKLLREGISSSVWVAYKMSQDTSEEIPSEFYSQKKPLPLSVMLLSGDYSVMTLEGAKKRGWTDSDKVPNEKVKSSIKDILQSSGATTFEEVGKVLHVQYANLEEGQIEDNLRDLMLSSSISTYEGRTDQKQCPANMVDGFISHDHQFRPDEVIISRGELIERGWNQSTKKEFNLSGNDSAKKLFPILKRIGSLYTRSGAKSTINTLDLAGLSLPGGARLRIVLDDATPDDIKRLDELFQVVCDVTKVDSETEVDMTIRDPDADCALIKELKK